MNQVKAAFAVVTQESSESHLFFAQWNQHWQRFNFVGGKLEADESPLQCVIREVEEELSLSFEADFVILTPRIRKLNFTEVSKRTGELTDYEMTFFAGEFVNPGLHERLVDRRENRWLSLAEILAEQTVDGQRISRLMSMLLGQDEP